MNYIKLFEDGTSEAVDVKPSWGMYEKEHALDNREVYIDGNWYSTTGGELVTNGTFDTDISGWTETAMWSNGVIEVETVGSNRASSQISLAIGSEYTLAIDHIKLTGSTNVLYLSDTEGTLTNEKHLISMTVLGTYSTNFVADRANGYLVFLGAGNFGDKQKFDNISVYKKEATLGTPLTTPISLIPNPIMVQAETPQYIDYSRSLSENVMEDLEVAGDITTHGEFKGKNACTAWVNFDGTTTPPTIRDSFNVSDVVRTATGKYDVYFEEDMDNLGYSSTFGVEPFNTASANHVAHPQFGGLTLNKITLITGAGTLYNEPTVNVHIMGGKN